MSIHDVMTAAIEAGRRAHKNRSSARLAGAAWEALRDNSYSIVEVGSRPQSQDAAKLAAIRKLCEATADCTPDGAWYVPVEDLYDVLDGLVPAGAQS